MPKAASWDRSIPKSHVPAPLRAGSVLAHVPAPLGELDLSQHCTRASPTSSWACPEPTHSSATGPGFSLGTGPSVPITGGQCGTCPTDPTAIAKPGRAECWLQILPSDPALLPSVTQARGNLLLPALPHQINSLLIRDMPQHSPSVNVGGAGHLQGFLFVSKLDTQLGAAPFSMQGKISP